ncbi:MAG: Ig-like domain-containing protein, partial [bacterium]|nr:Ig-like domain-containing protein [bacterium]
MNKLRTLFTGGCCLASALTIIALALSGLLMAVFWQRDVAHSAPSPIPTLTLVPAPTLHVVSVTPEDRSQDVGSQTVIEIIFNQSMVHLHTPSEEEPRPHPIVIRPWVEGRGEWVLANVYRFHPTGMDKATRYTITVPAGITDLNGNTLSDDYTFTFATTRPLVVSTSPRPDDPWVDPGGKVHISFDTPVDRQSVESHFSLVDRFEQPVAGTFDWPSDRIMTFSPNALMERSAAYQATLLAGSRADGRELAIVRELAWQFTVAGLPEVISSAPDDGDMAARPDGKLAIQFNMPMDTASVEAALHIEPEPEYLDLEWDQNDSRLQAYVDFDPSAEYRILLDDGAVDIHGETLVGNRSIVFRNAPLDPVLHLYGPSGGYQGPVSSYVADQAIEQFIQARNLSEVEFTLSAIDPADFIAAYHNRYEAPDTATIPRTQFHTWTQSLDLPLNRIKYIPATIAGPGEADADDRLPPGIYTLKAQAQGLQDTRFMIVSRANLALK